MTESLNRINLILISRKSLKFRQRNRIRNQNILKLLCI